MGETLDSSLAGLCDCGCCAGNADETPAPVQNREGLDEIRYRAGTYGEFKRTMLAALSEARFPALAPLTTRADDDFTIALLDAWAVTADVLTFYQERLANEAFLRTAREPGSVRRLAQLIGYAGKPGVSATVFLAFTLDTAPGAPLLATITAGTQVQSVPGQNEQPQTFETAADFAARAEWNALRPAQTEPVQINAGLRSLYLRGVATQLSPGDAILITAGDPPDHTAPLANFRVCTRVTPDPAADRTRVEWDAGLDAATPGEVRVHAFRQRAALFGHNAPDPTHLIGADGKALPAWDSTKFCIRDSVIDLDAAYPKIVPGSFVVLTRPDGTAALYRAKTVAYPSRAEFFLSGKVTRIVPGAADGLADNAFPLRDTLVYAQSEPLATAPPPLTTRAPDTATLPVALADGTLAPVEGRRLTLDRLATAPVAGQPLLVTGKRVRVGPASGESPLTLTDDTGKITRTLHPGETAVVLQPPVVAAKQATWRLRHAEGFDATVQTSVGALVLSPSLADDPFVSQLATVQAWSGNPSEIVLAGAGLTEVLDRPTVSVAANVVLATHGETVEETAGSGDAAQAFQTFALRQSPLTYVRADNIAGFTSTLQVRVDGLLWNAVPSLYERGPFEHIYLEQPGDAGATAVVFGDGANGARLPTGQGNVRGRYRKGGGLAGNVRAGQLTQLLTRPLGVRGVGNPLAADGASEPETIADARQHAPLTVLTLDRVVSLRDYEDFARNYPGVGKARAIWTWDGRTRGVFVTVAGPGGAALPAGGSTLGGLLKSFAAAGDPFVPVWAAAFRAAQFTVAATVTVDPQYEAPVVLAAVRAALRQGFSFAARTFGQPVFTSEVIAAMQAVPGVASVDLTHLQRTDRTDPAEPAPRLLADLPTGGSGNATQPAELLLLAPGDLSDIRSAV